MEDLKHELIALASYVGAGPSSDEVTIEDLIARIRWGIDHITNVSMTDDRRDAIRYRRLRILGVPMRNQYGSGLRSFFTNLDERVDEDLKYYHRGEHKEIA